MSTYHVTGNSFKNMIFSLDDLKTKINNLNKRDLYLFDESIRFHISSLVIKNNCIILKLDNIKSVIFENEAYIIFQNIDINKIASHYKGGLVKFLENNTVFHLSILEYLFIITVHQLDEELTEISNKFKLVNKIDIDNKFIQIQSSLLNLEFRVKELHTLTEDLKENKDDLNEIALGKIDSSEVEKMLESYYMKLEDIYNDIKKLVKEMDNIQKIANIKLAQDRNKIAKINLDLSILSLCISIGGYVGNIFGMNLKNHIEKNNYTFFIISTMSLGVILISYIIQKNMFKFN